MAGHDPRRGATRVTVPGGTPWRAARAVAAALQQHGFQAWFVGGCVRDLLLDRPIQDVDLATDCVPERITALFDKTVTVGKSFGVVVVILPDGSHVDVATFRHDGRYLDNRRPESVRFGSVEEDVARRDFTINALLLDPWNGQVVDHVGGLADLHERRLRAVGDARTRLAEDPLRVLRALRFAAVLELTIEPATWTAIQATALSGVSGERLMQEWSKATRGVHRRIYFELLCASGRIQDLCPVVAALPAAVRAATAAALGRLPGQAGFALVLSAWLSGAAPATAAAWILGRPVERTLQREVQWLLEQYAARASFQGLSVPARRRIARSPWAASLAALCLACDPDGGPTTALAQALAAEQRFGELRPLLTASALLALGMTPGPGLGELLKRLEDAQLEGRIGSEAEAVAQVRAWRADGSARG